MHVMSDAADYLEVKSDMCNFVSDPHSRQMQQITRGLIHIRSIFSATQDSLHRFILNSVLSINLGFG